MIHIFYGTPCICLLFLETSRRSSASHIPRTGRGASLRTASERPLVQPEEDLSGDLGRQDQIQVSVIPLQIPTILTLESTPIVAGTGTWIDQEPKTFQYFFAYLLLKKI